MSGSLLRAAAAPLALWTLALAGCSSDTGSSGTTDAGLGGDSAGTTGGPVSGPVDDHCAGKAQEVSQAVCHATRPADEAGEAEPDYGPTLFNSEGDDDDCKYHMKWTSTAVGQGADVTFTLTLTTTTDGAPATGGAEHMQAEVFLDETHPAPPTDQEVTETSPGVYTIGPVRFDAPGQWTVRFHVFEDCTDFDERSPHGHGAFFVAVP